MAHGTRNAESQYNNNKTLHGTRHTARGTINNLL